MLRLVDLLLSALGVMVLTPVMVILTITGWKQFGNPFFFQRRVGRFGKTFTLVKFRSMPINTANVPTHQIAMSQLNPYGAWIRRTKLDEIPQLFCVLIGTMSLVGPRPSLESQQELVRYRERAGVLELRPGITGLAQICNVDMSQPQKLARLDALMCRHMDLCCYLQILFKTVLGNGQGDRVV